MTYNIIVMSLFDLDLDSFDSFSTVLFTTITSSSYKIIKKHTMPTEHHIIIIKTEAKYANKTSFHIFFYDQSMIRPLKDIIIYNHTGTSHN